MENLLYNQADECVFNDDFYNAIPLFIESLEKGNFDSAYRLGTIYLDCYEELDMLSPDYKSAKYYFEIGANNDHKECQKELGLLFLNEESGFLNYFHGLKWILSSGIYNKEKEIERILKIIEIIFKKVESSIENELKDAIVFFEECIELTKNKQILNKLYTSRNGLIVYYAKIIIKEAKTFEELENKFSFFSNYFNKIFFSDSLSSFFMKKTELFLQTCSKVEDAKRFLEPMLQKEYGYKTEAISSIYLWIARAYRKGLYNTSVNTDLAIQNYQKAKTPIAASELDKFIISYCEELSITKQYDVLERYLPYIKSETLSRDYRNLIQNHKDVTYFENIKNKASISDISLYLELAELYEEGRGTPKSRSLALNIHNEVYNHYKNKESFDFLFKHYFYSKDIKSLKKLLIDGKKHNISFNSRQNGEYISLIAPYVSANYCVIKTKDAPSIDPEEDNIYYFVEYYKKWRVDNFPDNKFIKENYDTFLSIKWKTYNTNRALNFPAILRNFLKTITGDWIICTAPGHKKSKNFSNGVSNIINMTYLPPNFSLHNSIIQRSYTVAKKSTSTKGERVSDYKIDMQSLKICDGYDVTGKSILVVDDITTTGSTLIACKNILINAGASKVLLLALGKTKKQKDESY